jgi:hypothetical protein
MIPDVPSEDLLYQVVAARRTQFDNFVWQAPVLSLTAQAFLFTIALGADTRRLPRAVACVLSLIITSLSITLMARHRQAEVADAEWMEEFEKRHFGQDGAVHGASFRARRNSSRLRVGRMERWIPILPAFSTWVVGLSVFGLAAIFVLLLTLIAPETLSA